MRRFVARPAVIIFGALSVLACTTVSHADVRVVVAHNSNEEATPAFKFKDVPPPSQGDAGTKARFAIVDGRRDRNGGDVGKLHDSSLPTDEDQPSESFFFGAGTDGGRLLVDLGSIIEIKQVNTYSWHPDTRGPQVYKLYASAGNADGFNAQPKRGTDPSQRGWRLIAAVDTRPKKGEGGGQHGVSISDSEGNLGKVRYLLFDVFRTEAIDPFGNTFYCEIDIIDPNAPAVAAIPATEPRLDIFEAARGKYRIAIDTTETPDLTEWAQKELAPVLQEWYPKIVEMLPSKGYEAPRKVSIKFSKDMRGVAATGGTRIRCAANWYRQNLKGEAKGSVVHELVHVVQQYGRARRTNRNASRTPGWVVEGIADYIRWFRYEPETRGAEITRRGLSRARYDSSYRVSANFLNWVTEKHAKDIVQKLNAAAREGAYNEALWKKCTGRTLQELGDEWKQWLEKSLESGSGGADAKAAPAPVKVLTP